MELTVKGTRQVISKEYMQGVSAKNGEVTPL
jgi:hypothetical protein